MFYDRYLTHRVDPATADAILQVLDAVGGVGVVQHEHSGVLSAVCPRDEDLAFHPRHTSVVVITEDENTSKLSWIETLLHDSHYSYPPANGAGGSSCWCVVTSSVLTTNSEICVRAPSEPSKVSPALCKNRIDVAVVNCVGSFLWLHNWTSLKLNNNSITNKPLDTQSRSSVRTRPPWVRSTATPWAARHWRRTGRTRNTGRRSRRNVPAPSPLHPLLKDSIIPVDLLSFDFLTHHNWCLNLGDTFVNPIGNSVEDGWLLAGSGHLFRFRRHARLVVQVVAVYERL